MFPVLGFMFNGLFLGSALLAVIIGVMILFGVLAFKDTKSIERVLSQMTSARWILAVLAVLAGIAFLFFCASLVVGIIAQREKLEVKDIMAMMGLLLLVIQGVYKDYFNSKRDEVAPAPTNGVDLDKLATLLAKKLGITLPKEPPKLEPPKVDPPVEQPPTEPPK